MNWVNCGSCHGRGKVGCTSCSGRGRISRYGMGGVDISTCVVCYGSGRMRCNFCGGRGQIFSPAQQAPSSDYDPKDFLRGLQELYNNSESPGTFILTIFLVVRYHLDNNKHTLADFGIPDDKGQLLADAISKETEEERSNASQKFIDWLAEEGWITTS